MEGGITPSDVQAVCAGFVYALGQCQCPRGCGTGTGRVVGDRVGNPSAESWTGPTAAPVCCFGEMARVR